MATIKNNNMDPNTGRYKSGLNDVYGPARNRDKAFTSEEMGRMFPGDYPERGTDSYGWGPTLIKSYAMAIMQEATGSILAHAMHIYNSATDIAARAIESTKPAEVRALLPEGMGRPKGKHFLKVRMNSLPGSAAALYPSMCYTVVDMRTWLVSEKGLREAYASLVDDLKAAKRRKDAEGAIGWQERQRMVGKTFALTALP